MPKAFTEREKALIRARLVENGHKAFAQYGLRRTSVDDLTHQAGISKGAFYLFYDSKEALYMEVMEDAERSFRQEVLKEVDQPGSSPRSRLKHVFQTAFSIWKSVPLLKMVTQAEYTLLLEKLPPEKVQEHLQSDRDFIEVLVQRCQAAGIPITAEADQIAGLMNAMFFVSLHEEDFGPRTDTGTIDLLLDLIVAYCLGEIPAIAHASHNPNGASLL